MNISKAAKKISSHIGQNIMNLPIEHGFMIDKTGKVIDKFVGDESHIKVEFKKNSSFQFYEPKRNSLFIHNHPNTSLLSFPDLRMGIYFNLKEIQAINNVFTHIMEIPKELSDTQRAVCLFVVRKYEKIYNIFQKTILEKTGSQNEEILSKCFMKYNRFMAKELNLAGGIRFKTIPTTEESKQRFLELHKRHKSMKVEA